MLAIPDRPGLGITIRDDFVRRHRKPGESWKVLRTLKLLELIRERGFKPGDKLPSERDLAALFGMSRSAVRESLIRLDTLRIVESRPKSGVYLQPYGAERSIEAMVLFAETNTPLSAAEVAQSVELRSVLENEAMRLACLRRTQSDLKDLQQILRDSAAAITRGETLAELDAQFHKAIVAATKNDVLLRFINVFYRMSRKRREIYFDAPQQANARTPSTCSCTARSRRRMRCWASRSAPPLEGR
jgi:DNA-binding FadR family transcriptional regulator